MTFRVLFFFFLSQGLWAANYIWPLSNSITSDSMNTSFGPRINYSMWDMHPGIDLPGVLGTPLYNSRAGTVFLSGSAGTDGYDNRHVSVLTNDPVDGVLYMIYMHLDSIDAAVTVGAPVSQGQLIGTLGMDGATYAHCHFEFRLGNPTHTYCVHPMSYLPYIDTANFTAPVSDRFNRKGGLMAARLLFGAPDKNEGDLIRVEVDLKQGGSLLSTRVVDFNDRSTIPAFLPLQGGDPQLYTNDIGVEGYQTSNMVLDGRTDLKEAVLVKNLPASCDTLIARVYDLGGNISTSASIPVVAQSAVSEYLDFEDGLMPPTGWSAVTSTTGTGTSVSNSTSAFHSGSRGMFGQDLSTTEISTQRAGIEYALPSGRFEWLGEAWVEPVQLPVPGQDTYPLAFFAGGGNLSVSARIRNQGGTIVAGITAKKPDGSLTGISSSEVISSGVWRKWTLTVLRVGTRETTAVLYLDGVEVTRVDWDSTVYEPQIFRAGIALNGASTTAELYEDEVRVYEDTDEMLTPASTPTNTVTNTPTNTGQNTATNSPTSTPTRTATNTTTSTATSTATNTSTQSPTATCSNTSTNTAVNTATNTPTSTSTKTSTNTPTNSSTSSSTRTATSTSTTTPTSTITSTPTDTYTVTPTSTPTLTETPCGYPGNTCTPTATPLGSTKPSILPNPGVGTAPVSLYLPLDSQIQDVKVQVFTVAFRKVQEQVWPNLTGTTTVVLSTKDQWGNTLASGLYYVVVTTAQGRTILKFLLLR